MKIIDRHKSHICPEVNENIRFLSNADIEDCLKRWTSWPFLDYNSLDKSGKQMSNCYKTSLAIYSLHAELQPQVLLWVHHPVVTGGRDVEH